MKVVINDNYGGFALSYKAMRWLVDEKGWLLISNNEFSENFKKYQNKIELIRICYSKGKGKLHVNCYNDIQFRSHPDLIECVQNLGREAAWDTLHRDDNEGDTLKIVEIPDGIDVEICEGDGGLEYIAEKHRVWF